jgi:predicted short-subunit dehydrogenase-like oxidoreductase (DUF2520 family)
VDVAVVGAGRAGTALAVLLRRAGHAVVAVSGRGDTERRAQEFLPGVPVLGTPEAAAEADLVLLGVPDALIEPTADALAGGLREGAAVAHLSGANGLGPLRALEAAGTRILALHPLQTFPSVAAALERVPGSSIAVTARDEEGFALGERIAGDVGARPFRLADADRALYHAGGVLASNGAVALLALAEEVLSGAGVPDPLDRLLPLVRASVENAGESGPDEALTGPVVRGDAETVERNLRALSERAPSAVPVYVAVARAAADLAVRAGRLTEAGRDQIEAVLAAWG